MGNYNGTGENKTVGCDAEAAEGEGGEEAVDAEGQTEIRKQEEKTMMENIDNMARIEREIEKRMEDACEKSLAHVGTSKRVQELAA